MCFRPSRRAGSGKKMQKNKNRPYAPAVAGFFTGIAVYYAASKFPGINISSLYMPLFGLVFGLIYSFVCVLLEKHFFHENSSRPGLICLSSFLAAPAVILSVIFGEKLASLEFSMLGNINMPRGGFVTTGMDTYAAVLSAGAAIIFPAAAFIIFLAREAIASGRVSKKAVFMAALAVSLTAGAYNTFVYPPTGDEPHYLIMSQSLVTDFDMNLENDYVSEKTYRKFYPAELEYKNIHNFPGREGRGIYSIHNPGLSFLIALPYMAGGRYGAQAVIAIFAALLSLLIFRASVKAGADERVSAAAALTASAVIPFSAGASLILTEIPSACAIVYCAFLISDILAGRETGKMENLAFFSCLGLLVWLHPKLFIFSSLFWAAWMWGTIAKNKFRATDAAVYHLPLLALAALYIFYYYAIFGFFAPTGMKGIYVSSSFFFDYNPLHMIKAFFAIMFDRDYGLIFYSPVFIISIAGVISLIAKKQHVKLMPFYLTLPYFSLFLVWNDWTGSMAPARQMIPAACVWAVYAAVFISDAAIKQGKIISVLAVFSVAVSAVLSAFPFLRYAASKDKIYAVIAQKAGYLLWLFPSYRDKITLQTALITALYAVFTVFIVQRLLKGRGLK